MVNRLLLSFPPVLSKRLLAKGVCSLPEIQQALRSGKILLGAGTTTAHVYLELFGRPPDGALACGMVTGKGMCVGQGMTDFVGTHGHARFWLFDRGQLVPCDELEPVLETLGSEDVFVKGANAIDASGQAGVLLGVDSGGTIGKAIGHVMAKGVRLVIPVGLEKAILGSVADASQQMGTRRLTQASGMPVGLLPLSGIVVTEIEAVRRLLPDVEVSQVASGGVAGGEGAVMLLIEGEQNEIERMVNLYTELRQNEDLAGMETRPAVCAEHKWPACIEKNILYKGNVKQGI
jgi:hypothetical protein